MSKEDEDLQEDLLMLESIFDDFKKWKDRIQKPKEPTKPTNSDTLRDLEDVEDTTTIDIDGFKGNNDLIKFIKFVSNVNNLQKIESKKDLLMIVKKYKEIMDVLLIVFPLLKTKARQFGVVIPSLNKEQEDLRKRLMKIFNE